MLAPAAASSLDKPNAIAAQNLLSPSRPATGGRPGKGNEALPERSERRRFNLVIVTPHEALRRPLESAQYASYDYRAALNAAGMTASMSRKADCFDNAPMESFFHTLKTEPVLRLTLDNVPPLGKE